MFEDDKRIYKRFPVDCPVEIVWENETVPARLIELSVISAMIECQADLGNVQEVHLRTDFTTGVLSGKIVRVEPAGGLFHWILLFDGLSDKNMEEIFVQLKAD